MKIVGLTGGIGSGKSTVAKYFTECGVPVYNADIEAKKVVLIPEVKQQIINLLGEESFKGDSYNTKYVSERVFNDHNLLAQLNAIIHPAVVAHFESWIKKQHAQYVIKEAAILFESGSYKQCDKIILVVAPKKSKLLRVMHRDNVTEQEVLFRMKSQWTDKQKKSMADYIINNNSSLEQIKSQVISLHQIL